MSAEAVMCLSLITLKNSTVLFKQLDDVLETDDDDDNETAELRHRYSMNALKSQRCTRCFSLTGCGVRLDS